MVEANIPLQAYVRTPEIHLNSESLLPPVGCDILVEVFDGVLIRVERTGYVANKENTMEYKVVFQEDKPVLRGLFICPVIEGRFKWTYP